MPRGCWCLSPTLDHDERKTQDTGAASTAQERRFSAADHSSQNGSSAVSQGVDQGGSDDKSFTAEVETGSRKDTRSKKTQRTATLQELSTKYQRGIFDPTKLASRALQTQETEGRKVSDSTASPSTPCQAPEGEVPAKSRKSRDESESNYTLDSDDVQSKDGRPVFSTRSTISNATSRPQPIHELQNLLGVTLSTMASDFSNEPSLATENSGTHPSINSRKSSTEQLGSREATLRSVKSQKDPSTPRENLRATKSQESFNKHSSRSQKENAKSQRGKGRSQRGEAASPSVTQAVRNSIGLRQASMGTPIQKDHELNPGAISLSPWLSVSLDTSPLQGHPHYQILDILGGGTSGHVFLCLDRRSKEKVVVKMLGRGVSNAKVAEREIANLRLCSMHPYIIHMREVFLTEDYIAIAMDCADGGNLTGYIAKYQSGKAGRGLSDERSRWIFYQVVVAVDFCHKLGFANRDIKLDNVLLMEPDRRKTTVPTVKLSDFGFSKDEYADSVCKTACGTPECVAPEILAGGLYDGKFSDIWSMGVLFYNMLTGNYPFSRPADKELDTKSAMRKLFVRIMGGQYAPPPHISREAHDLLAQMLTVEPERRIKVAEILVHPFFMNHRNKSQTDMMSVNESLLQVPDTMLTGFFGQTEEDVAALLKEGSRQPSLSPENYS